MKNPTLTILLCATCSTIAKAQNLVPNPSFEEYNECVYWLPDPGGGGYPTQIAYSPNYDIFPTATYWVAPLYFAHPGYYNKCDTTPYGHGVPKNTFGYQDAHKGGAYASIYLFSRVFNIWDDLRQYLEAKLTHPLTGGHNYYISFYVSLAVGSNSVGYGTFVTTDNVGAYISDTMVSDSMAFGTAFLTKPVTVRNPPGKYITDTAGWTKISGTYTAHGGEQWITIGRFNDGLPANDSFMFSIRDSTVNNDSFVYCHVYVDDVCVMDITDSTGHAADSSFCVASFPAIITGSVEGTEYKWNTGATTASITVNKPGKYWRTTTSDCYYFTDTLRVQARPHFNLGNDTTTCNEIPIRLGVSQYDTRYLWSTGDTTCCIATTTQGTYAVTLTNSCGTASDAIQIAIKRPCHDCLLLSNAFTPNADGINDVWLPQTKCALRFYRLRIYNRYGQQVFETTNTTSGWDGTFKGTPQGIGVFCYYIEYSTDLQTDGKRELLKGNVTIIR